MNLIPCLVKVTVKMNRVTLHGKVLLFLVFQGSLSGVPDVLGGVGCDKGLVRVASLDDGCDERLDCGVGEPRDFLVPLFVQTVSQGRSVMARRCSSSTFFLTTHR